MIIVKIRRSSEIKKCYFKSISFILYEHTIVLINRYHFHRKREITQIIFAINESLYNVLYPKHIFKIFIDIFFTS